ncbi:adenosine receptor A2a-like [Oculina patagonica]
MKESSCEAFLQFFPSVSEFDALHSTYVANSVFNSFLCYTAIMLNIVTIHAIRKNSSLPKTLKTLLLSLAVSDVGVGLVVQPFYTSVLVMWLQQNNPGCNTLNVFNIIMYFFSAASFFGVVAVSADRFLAIHLHLRYQELVTHKRVVAVVISIWVLSVFIPLMVAKGPLEVSFVTNFIFGVVSFFVTTMAYIRIYLVVRRHKNQIQALQLQQVEQSDEIANFASLIKSAFGIFYVFLVFLFCYLPYLISWGILKVNGPSTTWKRFSLSSCTLVFLNSSLNPVIYCWKMRHIRHAIMDILRNMSWLRNRASH